MHSSHPTPELRDDTVITDRAAQTIDLSDIEPEELHSRGIAAGYDPTVMAAAKIFVFGAGALAQNVLLTLALAGVGHLGVVDFDDFEPTNATKSPFYPTIQDTQRFGPGKAVNVANRVLAVMTAEQPSVRWAAAPMQELGDSCIRWADVAISAVDNPRARAWLTERCKVNRTPLVEAGFSGSSFNVSVFPPEPDTPCFRCLVPELEGTFSCTRYAQNAQAQQIIPAIQSVAAITGALVAEHAIACIHHRPSTLAGTRLYGDIRSLRWLPVTIDRAPSCPGRHEELPPRAEELTISPDDSLADLLQALDPNSTDIEILLPDEVVLTAPCTECGQGIHVMRTAATWLRAPKCANCGGPWTHLTNDDPTPRAETYLSHESPQTLLDLPCRHAGLPAAATIEIYPPEGPGYLTTMPGTIHDHYTTITRESVH